MTPGESFFRAGGTLPPTVESYVARAADRDLFEALRQGQFAYLLTSRQMGKSSLVVRTARKLREGGTAVAFVDLTSIGAEGLAPETWYFSLLLAVGRELGREDEFEQCWESSGLAPVQRWFSAIEQVVLSRSEQSVVIVMDEIDMVQSLSFSTDDFFAAIRECYNRRAHHPLFERLTFCLVGVAAPADLIKNPRTTPFNIGRRIELFDLTHQEAAPLAAGFRTNGGTTLERVLYWTGGQPYLTQRLCQKVAESAEPSAAVVDQACRELFLFPQADQKNDHLVFVARRLKADPGHESHEQVLAAVLDLYSRVLAGKADRDDLTPASTTLKLAGVVRSADGRLRITNRIYRRVFDRKWIHANLPGAEKRRQRTAFRRGVMRALAAALPLVALMAGLSWWVLSHYVWTHYEYYNSYVRKWGVPHGIGRLDSDTVSHRSATYKFELQAGVVRAVEVVDASGQPTSGNEIAPYLEDGRDAALRSPAALPVRWEYSRDARGAVMAEAAFDRQHRRLWTFVYAPHADLSDRPWRVVGYYVNLSGRPDFRGLSTAQYIEILRDDSGFDVQVRYRDGEDRFAPLSRGGADCGSTFTVDERGLVSERIQMEIPPESGTDPPRLAWFDGCAGQIWLYDAMGNILESIFVNRDGQQNVPHDGSGRTVYVYDPYGRQIEETYVDAAGRPTLTNSGYAAVKRAYDDRGREVEAAYFDASGHPTLTADGVSIEQTEYSSEGHPIRIRYLDTTGTATYHKDGYHQVVQSFDENGNLVERLFRGKQGDLVVRRGGYHRERRAYDERGLLVETAYDALDLKPTLIDDGYCRVTREFDSRGYQVREEYWGLHGRRVTTVRGMAQWRATLDARGNQIAVDYLDEFGNLAETVDGYARVVSTRGASGEVLEEQYFDRNGQLAVNQSSDLAISRSTFKAGKETGYESLNERGKPPQNSRWMVKGSAEPDETWSNVRWIYTTSSGSQVRQEETYDPRRRLVRQVRFDLADNTFMTGTSSWEAEYDSWGRKTRVDYLTDDGSSLVRGTFETTIYDQWGNALEIAYFESDGKRRPEGGFALKKQKFDPLGHVIEEATFDTDGHPVAVNQVSRIVRTYTPDGKLATEEFFDPPNQLAAGPDGYAARKNAYDQARNLVRVEYLGPDRRPVKGPGGIASITTTHSSWGAPLTIEYRDELGGLVVNAGEEYARAEFAYNAAGQKVSESFWDSAGVPFAGETRGHFRAEWRYDDAGRLLESTRFGTSPETNVYAERQIHAPHGEIAEVQYIDEAGRLTHHELFGYARRIVEFMEQTGEPKPSAERFLDADGKPVVDLSRGYAFQRWSYDDQGRMSRRSFEDAEGNPVLVLEDGEEFATIEWQHDDEDGSVVATLRGRQYQGTEGEAVEFIAERRTNDAGRPKASYDGYAFHEMRYDPLRPGLLIAEWYLGDKGSPVLGPDGYYRLVQTWDEEGNVRERAYLDERGAPKLSVEGYGRTAREYAGGRLTEESFFGERGELVPGPEGFARRRIERDAALRQVKVSFYDDQDRPMIVGTGYSEIRLTFDGADRLTAEEYLDRDGKLMVSENGFARMTQQFLPEGTCVDRAYFGADERPIVLRDPGCEMDVSRWSAGYDSTGRLTREDFYGADGRLLWEGGVFASVIYGHSDDGEANEVSFADSGGKPLDVEATDAVRYRIPQLSPIRYYFIDEKDRSVYRQLEKVGPHRLMSELVPEFVHLHLPLVDPELAATVLGPTFCRAVRIRKGDGWQVDLYRTASGTNLVAQSWNYDQSRFACRTPSGGGGIATWSLEPPTEAGSLVMYRLMHVDESGDRATCDRGYAVATVRLFNEEELSQFAADRNRDVHVVEFFSADGKPARYRNTVHRIRRWEPMTSSDRQVAFYDESNKRIPVDLEVKEVAPSGWAATMGILPGDVLLGIRVQEASPLSGDRSLQRSPPQSQQSALIAPESPSRDVSRFESAQDAAARLEEVVFAPPNQEQDARGDVRLVIMRMGEPLALPLQPSRASLDVDPALSLVLAQRIGQLDLELPAYRYWRPGYTPSSEFIVPPPPPPMNGDSVSPVLLNPSPLPCP